MRKMFADCFSSLDDIPRKQRGDACVVLGALRKARRFSCFEVDGSLGGALDEIQRRGWAVFDSTSVGYPWVKVEVTAEGQRVLGPAP